MAPKLVLIEDNLDLRMGYRQVLAHAGYEGLCARDGEEGLVLIRDHRPDVVVTDLLLPRRGGLDVLRSLKSDTTTAQIPVLVLSSLPQSNENKLMLEGAANYVVMSRLADGRALIAEVEKVLQS